MGQPDDDRRKREKMGPAGKPAGRGGGAQRAGVFEFEIRNPPLKDAAGAHKIVFAPGCIRFEGYSPPLWIVQRSSQ